MKKIFIDTNIFLNMYRANLPKDISVMMKLIYDSKKYFITTEQSINEFNRNRYTTIETVIYEFNKKTQIDNGYPSFIQSLKSFENYDKSIKKLLQNKKTVLDEIETILYDKSKDSIYKKFTALCKSNNVIHTTKEIFRLAEIRKLSGNPPTSDKNTCCDEIIWESLLDYCKNNLCDLIIVSNDNTFHKNKDFLVDEYNRLTGATLEITKNITTAYTIVGIDISDEVKVAEDSIRWTDIIVTALSNLGGTATLKDIYSEAIDILCFNDSFTKSQNKEKESTIRGILQRFSSDCSGVYNGKKDLFHQIGDGIWELRQ